MFKVNKFFVGLLVAASLVTASTVFADDETSTTGKILLNTHDPASLLTIGLSKGVEVRYVNDVATNAEAQWYVVASVHSGGNKGYATAQNLTNIMVTEYKPGEPTTDLLATIPVVEASKEDWPSGPVSAWVAQ